MQARMNRIKIRIRAGLISGLMISPIKLIVLAMIAIKPITNRAKKIIHIIDIPFLEFEPESNH